MPLKKIVFTRHPPFYLFCWILADHYLLEIHFPLLTLGTPPMALEQPEDTLEVPQLLAKISLLSTN